MDSVKQRKNSAHPVCKTSGVSLIFHVVCARRLVPVPAAAGGAAFGAQAQRCLVRVAGARLVVALGVALVVAGRTRAGLARGADALAVALTSV